MDIILSASKWHNFIVARLFEDALYFPVLILMVFAFFRTKEFKNNQSLRFVIVAAVVTLLTRYFYFVSVEGRINTRYLFSFVFFIVLLCLPGFTVMLSGLEKIFKNTERVKKKHLAVFLLILAAACGAGKALGPPDKKDYIHASSEILKAASPAVLLTDLKDYRRLGWHTKAKVIKMSSAVDINNPRIWDDALKALSSPNKKLFVMVKSRNEDFRKSISNAGIKELKLLREFKTKRERFYSLYKVEIVKGTGR